MNDVFSDSGIDGDHPPISGTVGNHVLSAGKTVISSSTTTLATRNGAAPRKMLMMLCPEIDEQTFRHMPTGGVTRPTVKTQ